jgi:hypothetical protein
MRIDDRRAIVGVREGPSQDAFLERYILLTRTASSVEQQLIATSTVMRARAAFREESGRIWLFDEFRNVHYGTFEAGFVRTPTLAPYKRDVTDLHPFWIAGVPAPFRVYLGTFDQSVLRFDGERWTRIHAGHSCDDPTFCYSGSILWLHDEDILAGVPGIAVLFHFSSTATQTIDLAEFGGPQVSDLARTVSGVLIANAVNHLTFGTVLISASNGASWIKAEDTPFEIRSIATHGERVLLGGRAGELREVVPSSGKLCPQQLPLPGSIYGVVEAADELMYVSGADTGVAVSYVSMKAHNRCGM